MLPTDESRRQDAIRRVVLAIMTWLATQDFSAMDVSYIRRAVRGYNPPDLPYSCLPLCEADIEESIERVLVFMNWVEPEESL